MKSARVVAVLVLAVVACHREPPKPEYPKFIAFSRLGTNVGPDGVVTEEKTTFDIGQPVHLTVKLNESPRGLQTRAIWSEVGGPRPRTPISAMRPRSSTTFATEPTPGGAVGYGYDRRPQGP